MTERTGGGVRARASGGSVNVGEAALAALEGHGGLRTVALGELRADVICAWRGTLPEEHRFEATQALRQVLNAAVAWELIDANPARRGVPNPLRRFPEKRPFESWEQINALAGNLDEVTGPMVVFGAATGLRPAELVALEYCDVDWTGGVVYVRRQLVRGQVKPPRRGAASAPCPCSRRRGTRLTGYPTWTGCCCSRRRTVVTSICTTSVPGSGDRRSAPLAEWDACDLALRCYGI